MARTLVVVGAGPGVGMAVARRFGREGFAVGLIARDADRLAHDVDALATSGITAAAFPADVLDRAGLVAAIRGVKERFGPIDVVEVSPTPPPEVLVTPRAITVDNVQAQFAYSVLSAITVVGEVLPDMVDRGDGGLLFCTAYSAVQPVPFSSNFAIAAAGLRNYADSLYHDLAADGVYAGIVEIAGLVDKTAGEAAPDQIPDPSPGGMSVIPSAEIGQLFWDLFTRRDRFEAVVGDPEVILRMLTTG